jgi:arsenate reductase
MAAAWLNKLCNPQKALGISAGTQPGGHVHPEVVQAMQEVGIDLSSARPQLLTTELATKATLLVTMGCGEACPYVPGLQKLDWPLPDPKGQSVDAVRSIRDDIRQRVVVLARERNWLLP